MAQLCNLVLISASVPGNVRNLNRNSLISFCYHRPKDLSCKKSQLSTCWIELRHSNLAPLIRWHSRSGSRSQDICASGQQQSLLARQPLHLVSSSLHHSTSVNKLCVFDLFLWSFCQATYGSGSSSRHPRPLKLLHIAFCFFSNLCQGGIWTLAHLTHVFF